MADESSKPDISLPWLLTLYVAGILSANATAAKLLVIKDVHVTTGALAIPLVYLTTDLINELHGAAVTRTVVWLGFVANTVLVAFTQACLHVTASPFGASQEAFAAVFATTPRIVVASTVAYLLSSLLDVWVFAKLREWTDGKHFWLRKNGSTVVSQLVDSALFATVAFAGKVPFGALVSMVLGQYLVKIVMAPLGTPLSYAVLWVVRRKA